jgi:hypothetical protein
MNTLLVIILIGLVVMVVVSLVRGIIAFLQTTRQDIDQGGDGNIRELQLKQNKMMFARIKFQGLALVVVAILLLINR